MKMQHLDNRDTPEQNTATRPLARRAARQLSPDEIAMVAGGKPYHTHATGPNGDDPNDPGI